VHTPHPELRTRAAVGLDWLVLLLLVAAAIIQWTGGDRFTLLGMRISARGAARPLILALGLVAVRVWLAPRTPPFRSTLDDWSRRWSYVYRRVADDIREGTLDFSLRRTALASLGICGAAVILLWTQLQHMTSVPDYGDPFLSIWRMGWIYTQLRGDPRPLFDGNIFYPERLTFTYSDSMLLPGLTAAPLLGLGIHPVVVYNLLFISGFVFSGIAAYLLVERLTGSPPAAFVSGLLYGFYPYHFEHYSHFELQMMQWIPLALLAMHRFVETTKPRYAFAAVVCVAAQLYSSMYYAVFLCLYSCVVLIVLLLTMRPRVRRLAIPAVGAAVLGIVLAYPIAYVYEESTKLKGTRTVEEVTVYSAEPSDYLRAHNRSIPYGARGLPGRQPERALFPGLVPIGLAAAGLIPPLGVARLTYFVGLVAAFDGSLGFNGLSYPYLYEWLSAVRGLRVPARYSVFVALSLAVLSGFGARRLLERSRGHVARSATLATLAGLSIFNSWPNLELRRVWSVPPPIYGPIAGARNVVLAELPIDPNVGLNARFMYFSLWHWASMVNGYSGFIPASFEQFEQAMREFPDPASIEVLRTRGVTHVSVNCAFYRRDCERWLKQIEALPDFRVVVGGRWQGSNVRLYKLVR
jgi:hypothetical protein